MNLSILFTALLSSCLLRSASSSSSDEPPPMKGEQHPKMNCFPTSCGALKGISYPFWVEGQQPPYCGFPNFKLTCTDHNIPILEMSPGKFQVKEIFYSNESVWLSNPPDINNTNVCTVEYWNLSFSLTPFAISAANKNLTFFFGCSEPHNNYYRIPCAADNGTTFAYFGDDLRSLNSCETVVIPVLDNWGAGVSEYMRLLNNGFLVNWTAADCADCSGSKGQCGYNNGTNGFMCICPDRAHTMLCALDEISDKGRKVKKIVIVSIGVSSGLILACLSLAFYRCRKWESNSYHEQNVEAFIEKYGSLVPKRYTFSELKKATRSFGEKLGQGGYGSVFKGTLSDGRVVAVKVLRIPENNNGEEFLNEVASIGRTFHVNVVSLLGFCYEGSKRALVYEFMCNGSLEKLVYLKEPKTEVDWERLYEIAIGVARGLEYLHRGCSTRIVHFDIKPHNILLDEDFCPKISDFGLAKLCHKKESMISIAGTRGTIGYIAPEVFSRNFGAVSSKSDVYSYGMMVLEMAGGRHCPNVAAAENSSEEYFPSWIYKRLDHIGGLQACGVTIEAEGTARKLIMVGLWCVQTLPQNRPSMSKVIEMLEGSIDDLRLPPKPYICSPLRSVMATSSVHDGDSRACSSSSTPLAVSTKETYVQTQ